MELRRVLFRSPGPLSAGAGSHPDRRVHQERAIPVSFLAAARDGGADAGFGLSSFGDDGEGGHLRAHPALAGARGHRELVSDRYHHRPRSEEHTSELQSLMRISYAVFCLKKQKQKNKQKKNRTKPDRCRQLESME